MAADMFMWFPEAAKGGMLKQNATKPKGESTDAHFSKKNALEIKSASGFGLEMQDTTGSGQMGSGGGKVKFGEMQVKKLIDLASVPLFEAAAAGAHFPTVNLAFRKQGGEKLTYLQFIFRQVYVKKIDFDCQEDNTEETITFTYNALGMRYVQQTATGGAGTGLQTAWSTSLNSPSMNVAGLQGQPAFDPDTHSD
ncbi:MAG: type VI secretion system tube protein Hcp [Acidobacteriaceae bacterium]|nr:type VI secretion system tube protein Hcp [Acidobacteriaceae bacterium]